VKSKVGVGTTMTVEIPARLDGHYEKKKKKEKKRRDELLKATTTTATRTSNTSSNTSVQMHCTSEEFNRTDQPLPTLPSKSKKRAIIPAPPPSSSDRQSSDIE
jgi:hypothetical protein